MSIINYLRDIFEQYSEIISIDKVAVHDDASKTYRVIFKYTLDAIDVIAKIKDSIKKTSMARILSYIIDGEKITALVQYKENDPIIEYLYRIYREFGEIEDITGDKVTYTIKFKECGHSAKSALLKCGNRGNRIINGRMYDIISGLSGTNAIKLSFSCLPFPPQSNPTNQSLNSIQEFEDVSAEASHVPMVSIPSPETIDNKLINRILNSSKYTNKQKLIILSHFA